MKKAFQYAAFAIVTLAAASALEVGMRFVDFETSHNPKPTMKENFSDAVWNFVHGTRHGQRPGQQPPVGPSTGGMS